MQVGEQDTSRDRGVSAHLTQSRFSSLNMASIQFQPLSNEVSQTQQRRIRNVTACGRGHGDEAAHWSVDPTGCRHADTNSHFHLDNRQELNQARVNKTAH